jgi:hypothetical protein
MNSSGLIKIGYFISDLLFNNQEKWIFCQATDARPSYLLWTDMAGICTFARAVIRHLEAIYYTHLAS